MNEASKNLNEASKNEANEAEGFSLDNPGRKHKEENRILDVLSGSHPASSDDEVDDESVFLHCERVSFSRSYH